MPTTKITRGKSFARAIDYDLGQGINKDDQEKIRQLPPTEDEAAVKGFTEGQRARLLATNVVGDTRAELADEFKRVAAQKSGIKEPVHKVSISLKPGEHLETRQWLEVGRSYLKAMGYKDAPFLIAQHREKDHEHIHIVTSRIDFNGKVVSDSFEQKKVRAWAREVEEQHNLSRTPERAEEKGLSRIEIEQAMRTQKTPPKLVLQQSITQTLSTNPETTDFIDALHKQNISIRVKTNNKKEILGISFGIDGRGFKGGSLGTKFTWQGLQKEGLKYEFERDYAKLEEASRRRSLTESQSAGSKPDDERVAEHAERNTYPAKTALEHAGTINHADRKRVAESARFGGEESRRETITRIESENGIASEQSTTQSISSATATDERILKEGDGAIESGYQSQLRWTRRFNSGEVETAGGFQSTEQPTEAATAEETFTRRQPIERHELAEVEYFRQQEVERQFELFKQLLIKSNDESGGIGLLSTPSETNHCNLSGAGIDNPTLGGTGRFAPANSGNDLVADVSNAPRSLGDIESVRFIDSNNAGSNVSGFVDNSHGFSGNAPLLGCTVSNVGADESVAGSVTLSANLRASLENAELTAKKTLAIEETLKIEEVEEIKSKGMENEMEKVSVLMM